MQVSIRFGLVTSQFQISSSGDYTAPASELLSRFDRRHRLRRSVLVAVWDDRR